MLAFCAVAMSAMAIVTSRKVPAGTQFQISWRVGAPDDGGEHPASEGWPVWTKIIAAEEHARTQQHLVKTDDSPPLAAPRPRAAYYLLW